MGFAPRAPVHAGMPPRQVQAIARSRSKQDVGGDVMCTGPKSNPRKRKLSDSADDPDAKKSKGPLGQPIARPASVSLPPARPPQGELWYYRRERNSTTVFVRGRLGHLQAFHI